MTTTPTYNPDTPVVPQNHDWDCAEQSTLWAVTALGRHPSDAWMESQMLADGVESTALGLMDGTGATLAAWITGQYSDPSEGTPTLKASSAANVSFDDVRSVAGLSPVLLGGHGWGAAGHWSGVRGYDAASDTLLLANPANGYAGVGQSMTRQQFSQVSPCAMVVVRADGSTAVPDPVPAPPIPTDTRAQAAALIEQAAALLVQARQLLEV